MTRRTPGDSYRWASQFDTGKRRYTGQQIADEFGVTRPTIYRHLAST